MPLGVRWTRRHSAVHYPTVQIVFTGSHLQRTIWSCESLIVMSTETSEPQRVAEFFSVETWRQLNCGRSSVRSVCDDRAGSAPDALEAGIEERLDRGLSVNHCPANVDFPTTGVDEFGGDGFVEADEADANGATKCVTVRADLEVAYRLPVEVDDLVAEQQWLGICQKELQHPARRAPRRVDRGQGVASDEPARLVEPEGEPESRLDRVVGVVDVHPEVSVCLLEAK